MKNPSPFLDTTIESVLREGAKRLTEVSDSPYLDAELLLCEIQSCQRNTLYAHPEATLPSKLLVHFQQLLARRQAGEPIAHIRGFKEFWSIDLKVDTSVLVPRPETELLVELTLQHVDRAKAEVLDLGTGSGAIALALASERPDWGISATDISYEALIIARENSIRLGFANICFLQGLWLEPLKQSHFDIIVSNPPYIDTQDYLNSPELSYEPEQALNGGKGGLKALETIINSAGSHLNDNGYLLLEHGYDQGKSVRNILKKNDFKAVETVRDNASLERISIGLWCAKYSQ